MLTAIFDYIVNIIAFASGIDLSIIPLILVGIIIIIINRRSRMSITTAAPHLA